MTTHKKLLSFIQDDLNLPAELALTWYRNGNVWTWDSGTCSKLAHCVYWFSSGGEVLYVGKAADLDSRMRGHWDDLNRHKVDRKLTGIVDVADRNGELVVWAARVPSQKIGEYNVPNEEAIETAMIWHINPPVNKAKRR